MTKLSGNTIYLTRGDSMALQVGLEYQDGSPYEPIPNDNLYFACKEDYEDTEYIIEKQIPIDTLILSLEPKDTEDLEQPMSLVYDVEMRFEDGEVQTVISGRLNIMEEVHE